MIQVTLRFTTLAAAIAALQAVPANTIASTDDSQAAPGNSKPARTPAPSPSAAAAASPASGASTASSTKPAESPAETPKPDATGATLDYEKDVKPIVIKVGAAGKRDNLVELLKKFGVTKGPEVPADKLPAFKAELEALVA